MQLTSPTHTLSISDSELFDFLSKVENFGAVMPENNKIFTIIDSDSFAFALKGMPEIVLKITDRIPNSAIVLGSTSEQFPFELKITIQSEPTGCSFYFDFNGTFNAMISMMIKTPLTNFIEALAQQTANHFTA